MVQYSCRRQPHLLNEVFGGHVVPFRKRFVYAPHLFLAYAHRYELLQHGKAEVLLERAYYYQIRYVYPVILLFVRPGHHLCADIVVYGGRGYYLLLLKLRRQIIKVLFQQHYHLLHIQPKIGDIIPPWQSEAIKISFPPSQLTGYKPFIIRHAEPPPYLIKHSTS